MLFRYESGQQVLLDIEQPDASYFHCKLMNHKPLLRMMKGEVLTIVKEVKGQQGWYIVKELPDYRFNKYALSSTVKNCCGQKQGEQE